MAVNWDKLRQPTDYFRIATMNDDQAVELCQHLKEDFLYVDDAFRNDEAIRSMLWGHFASGNCLIYEIKDGRGYVGFTDIQPGYKANAMMKFWGTDIWGPSFIKQLRTLVSMVMEEFELRRISTESPDRRIVQLAKMVGFKVEGTRKNDFRWDGMLFDNTLMGYTKETDNVLQG